MSVNILNQATRAIAVPDWFNSTPDLSTLWPALISGKARIVDSGATHAYHYFQFVIAGAAPGANKLTPRRVRILERVLLGDAPKVIAMDVGCSISTVATAVGCCLRAMGLSSGRIPALLVLMLHALHGKARRVELCVDRTPGQDGERQLLTSARLEANLGQKLSAAELAIVSLLVEGKTHVEMAKHRSTSVRTVANQIASAYRKLGISGRMDLLCYLVSGFEAKSGLSRAVPSVWSERSTGHAAH